MLSLLQVLQSAPQSGSGIWVGRPHTADAMLAADHLAMQLNSLLLGLHLGLLPGLHLGLMPAAHQTATATSVLGAGQRPLLWLSCACQQPGFCAVAEAQQTAHAMIHNVCYESLQLIVQSSVHMTLEASCAVFDTLASSTLALAYPCINACHGACQCQSEHDPLQMLLFMHSKQGLHCVG